MSSRELSFVGPYDLVRTLSPLRLGYDPTTRLSRGELCWATRTPDGPAALRLTRAGASAGASAGGRAGGSLVATAWGPGADWVLERADAIAGLRDDLDGFTELVRANPVTAALAARTPGVRMPRTERVFQALVPTILTQKVTWQEAARSYAALVRHFGEPAPGPLNLVLPPDPEAVAATPYWAFHPMGIEQRRADTLRRAAAVAAKLEGGHGSRLIGVPGIGVWTVAKVAQVAWGDADAVPVGDFHFPNQVAWALAREPRATDARMLELLEPFAPHRGRVILLVGNGVRAPAFGPRRPLRSFARY